MKALVLIGGFGTRLRPITYAIPKQLIPIAGKPMLYHVLDQLPSVVDGAILATGYKADVVEQFVRAHPPRIGVEFVEEKTPLGTGGGLRNAGDGVSDPFLLLNSDVIADVDVAGLIAFHRRSHGIGAMTLVEVEDTRPYGVAALGSDDRIARFVEKPAPEHAPSHWINAGVQIWERSVLERIPRGRPVSFETEIMPDLLPRGVFGYRSSGYWEDAGTPQRLLHSQRLLFDGGRGTHTPVPEGATVRGAVAAGEGSTAHGATLGPYVTLGARVHIAPGAHVEDSVLMDGSTVGAGARVIGSVIGPETAIPDGAVVEGQVLGAAPPS